MPIFYLHIRDGGELVEDPEGIDFPDLDAARREAVAAAREMLAEKILAGEEVDGQQIEICDDEGRLLAKVPFRETFSLPNSPLSE